MAMTLVREMRKRYLRLSSLVPDMMCRSPVCQRVPSLPARITRIYEDVANHLHFSEKSFSTSDDFLGPRPLYELT